MVVAEMNKSGIKNWDISERVMSLESSVIREILKISSQPGVISFAGGLPAPELFPTNELKQAMSDALDNYGPACVQYTITLGVIPLRALLAERASAAGEPTEADNLMITAGSQQGLDLVGRIFLQRGDYILTENPTYVGALQAFDYYGARYATIEMDDKGMIIDQVEANLKKHKPKFIYTISSFQNPTGITMSHERRVALVDLALKYDIPIVDDNPYGDVRFAGEPQPSMKSLAPEAVISLQTFSKVCAPGLRIGWMNAPKEIIRVIEKVKQGTDLHTNTLCQYIMLEFIKSGRLEPHIEKIKKDYLTKRDVMLSAMRRHFPDGISWTEPEGGLFLWVTLPEHMSAKEMLPEAVANKVAYVYGQPFFPNEERGANTLRLNFSNATHENIEIGIQRLAKLFREHM
ncbi:MAG: PLP-dependent aminotransferase family protein [bacterium]